MLRALLLAALVVSTASTLCLAQSSNGGDAVKQPTGGATLVFVTTFANTSKPFDAQSMVVKAFELAGLPQLSYFIGDRVQHVKSDFIFNSSWWISVKYTSNATAEAVYALRTNATALALLSLLAIQLPRRDDFSRDEVMGPLAIAGGVTIAVIVIFLIIFGFCIAKYSKEDGGGAGSRSGGSQVKFSSYSDDDGMVAAVAASRDAKSVQFSPETDI